ncbi:MAG: hypothetical protein AAF518_02725 [Spirochaetota bacterium]
MMKNTKQENMTFYYHYAITNLLKFVDDLGYIGSIQAVTAWNDFWYTQLQEEEPIES